MCFGRVTGKLEQEMFEDDIDVNLEKAQAFFERAEEVACTDNFDYAIDMYLEGLRLAPDALEDGHAPLRRMALIRQGKGGGKPSITDKVRRHGGKGSLEEMLNAEYLLAKDPDNISYAEAMLKACVAGCYRRPAEWIANLIFQDNRSLTRPLLNTYLLLKDSYREMELYDNAVAACQKALEMKPNDNELSVELRELTAQLTVQKGRYDQGGDFRDSIKDKDVQDQLHRQGQAVKSLDFQQRDVEEAKRAVDKLPSQNNILKLAEAMVHLDTEKGCLDAVKILEDAYVRFQDAAFKRRAGELRLRRLRHASRILKAILDKTPDNLAARTKLADVDKKLKAVNLEHCKWCVESYPTDLKLKYEYGKCLIQGGQFDQAIPLFQEARRDPGYKISALAKTGLCFFLKSWYTDAIEIFERALAACEVRDSNVAKELRYDLGRSYQENGQVDKALEMYRKLAQLDFGFKDVRQRIDELRSRDKPG